MTTVSVSAKPSVVRRRVKFTRGWFSRVVVWTILLVGSVIMLFPLIWMVSSSLKLEQRVFMFPPQLIPNPVRFQNYVEALTYKPFPVYLRNTVFIVVMNELAIVLAASFCAYGFARIRFPGRDFWFSTVLFTMMVPYVVMMVPQFVMFKRLNWIDTFLPLTVPYFFGGGGFNIFLLRQFFRTIPEELADAARIDGCNEFTIYARIIMPLAKPALITVAIFTFLNAWNDFMGPLLYLNSPERFTLAIGLANFRASFGSGLVSTGAGGRSRWDLLMAFATAMTVPVLVVFFLAQRYFVQGVVMTGLKG
ncbi:MAG: carbohydrate ABC transporter permease [Anaerolineae bacterium]|nr:carbohydrate ABC transporter permease [Anaerolineae bacterium]